ncbi:MAG: hypothetical protein H0W53_24330 [Acidobacteria bacterium]|nr:hypothetical protein [Acidobacteriota bacterium]
MSLPPLGVLSHQLQFVVDDRRVELAEERHGRGEWTTGRQTRGAPGTDLMVAGENPVARAVRVDLPLKLVAEGRSRG